MDTTLMKEGSITNINRVQVFDPTGCMVDIHLRFWFCKKKKKKKKMDFLCRFYYSFPVVDFTPLICYLPYKNFRSLKNTDILSLRQPTGRVVGVVIPHHLSY